MEDAGRFFVLLASKPDYGDASSYG